MRMDAKGHVRILPLAVSKVHQTLTEVGSSASKLASIFRCWQRRTAPILGHWLPTYLQIMGYWLPRLLIIKRIATWKAKEPKVLGHYTLGSAQMQEKSPNEVAIGP